MSFLRKLLSKPVIAYLPVRVRGGIADGARWTLFPWTSYWRGTHEPIAQMRILSLQSDWTGLHVWDLGSHYGLYSIGFGRHVGPTGSVASFEPNQLSYARLVCHVQRNALSHAKPFPWAVSDNEGLKYMVFYDGMETTTSHLAYENETWNESIETKDVPTVRLDELVHSGQINPPDFVKVDIEGHGHKALAGAAVTIAKCRPILMISMHSEHEIAGVRKILTPLHYKITSVLPGAPKTPTCGYDYIFEPLSV